MARDHILMLSLCGIIIINIIAIVLLNNHLADQQALTATRAQEQVVPIVPPPPIVRNQPLVRTLLISDATLCPDCFDISKYVTALNDTIFMAVEHSAPIAQFTTGRLPVLAFNQTLEEYPQILQGWEQVGYTVTIPTGPYAGKWYVLPTQNAPYYSVKDSRVHGRVTVTYITMTSCTGCYDVYSNRRSLNSSRITPYREITVDAQSKEGNALIARYNITRVPTLLMDREASEYPNLQPGWSVVGTVESDGTYVLRDLQRLKVTYFDLARAKLMKP